MSLLEIFKSGQHTDSQGREWAFSREDMEASVAAYDPAVFSAPLVVGHPQMEDPAYGWVESITLDGDVVKAKPDRVEPQFAALVNEGRFPKMSASWFPPTHPSNPKPGVWYLRHVGFLGAAAPAIPGLKPASFSGAEDGLVTVEFAASDLDSRSTLADLARRMRDWMLAQFGQEAADRVVPAYLAQEAEAAQREAMEEEYNADEPGFSAPNNPPEEVTTVKPENKPKAGEEAADFAARESALEAREQALAKKEAQARKDDIASFAEQLVKEGKVLPAEKEALVAFMAAQDEDVEVCFASNDGEVKKPANTWFRDFLTGLPQRVDFSERGADTEEAVSTASFAAPAGYSVDPERLALHQKAQAYQAEHKCDYNTALSAVGG
ncbi:prolipoprotein diacylglyceryl transferase [Marinobacter shengliensis]|uniref:hypothetical protein n=1 Tax=Marinobacter shengliensis TaxID=1389223 RepID=UPI0025735F8A|nr:hypothetical protein [Marinobacter shengliensis]BEH14263.1 hypothetical protein MAALD49_16310 [Marinobacter shengliensis]